MNTLVNLEARIQSIVENFLVKMIPGGKPEDQVSQKLASLLQAQIWSGTGEDNLAPNVFKILANPSQADKWSHEPVFLDELAQALELAGMEANIRFASRISISITADDSLAEGDVQVIASHSSGSTSETQGMQPGSVVQETARNNPDNAFLIKNGKEIIPIDQSMINLGRRLDNHAVMDDPRVSRNHAQIRIIKGNYVIFDLNSKGGTFVNGNRIHQSSLNPGDVISLAGATLIFSRDQPEPDPKHPASVPSNLLVQDHATEGHLEGKKPAK